MPLRFPLLLVLACAGAGAQQYPFIPIAGSPKNIEHILQDRQSRIWISTLEDVLCFDGARFFSLRPFGLPMTTTFSLSEDDQGGILIGSQNGAYRFSDGRLEKLPPDITAARVTAVAAGLLLVTGIKAGASEPSSYRLRRNRGMWQATELTGWSLGDFRTRDPGGSILAACPGGWCEYSAQLIANWTPQHPIAPIIHRTSVTVRNVLKDRSGCLWFRTLESAAYQCPGDSIPVPLPALVAGRNVWASVEEAHDGSILFANAASLAIGRPGAFQIATPENGLPVDTISCAIQAKDGSIWAGSIGGLYRFPHPFRLTYWNSRYGPFWAILRSRGKMFAGTSSGIATLTDDGEWRVLPATRGLGAISSLLAEPDGSLYAAVAGKSVIHLRMPDGATDARLANGQEVQPQFLAQAANGDLWVAGVGYYRLTRHGGELIASPESPPGTLPPDPFIASGPSGGIWGCYSGELIHREKKEWQTIAGDGIPHGLCRSLAFSSGDVWAGYNTGLAWVRVNSGGASQVRPFATSGDAGAGNAWTFGTDARGWLWRGSIDGMFAATEAQAHRGAWIGLGGADGLNVLDVNHNAFFGDSDGSVWWAAASSVFRFKPTPDLVEPRAHPAVFVSAFSIGGQPPKIAEAFDQFPSHQKLTVHLASLRFEERNAIRIRYRVLPEQKDWRETASLDLELGSPSWGNHTLEFQSRFTTREWSPPQSRVLVVMPPWWFSWPALLAFAGMACGAAAGSTAWRRKLKARGRIQLPDLDLLRAAALTPESQLPGTTLDRFEVLHVIARGGFATVLKGRDLRTQRFCAIKVFRQEVLDEEWVAHRFQQEVSALEQIRDRSVVSIYGHGVVPEGAPYLVMELIEGGTLRELLKNGPLSLGRAASLLEQAGNALGQIHARDIFHRDLKPENLMLRKNARPGNELVLIDFSIAIVKAPDHTVHGISRAAGTIYYMAPEQAVGFATAASDIYSLAKILLEMLTGQKLSTLLPHAAMDLPEKVRNLVHAMPLHLSKESVNLLGSALEFDPARRPQVAQAFAAPIVRDLVAASSDRAANLYPSPRDGESAAGSTQ